MQLPVVRYSMHEHLSALGQFSKSWTTTRPGSRSQKLKVLLDGDILL